MFETARAWLQAGEPAVLVQVIETRGSAPREAGTRMLVSATQAVGTVGGGHLELSAMVVARAMLGQGATAAQSVPHSVHYALGPSLGQCCGGTMTLHFERLSAAHIAAWPQAVPRFHVQLYGAGHVGRAVARLLATLPVRVDWVDEREAEFPRCLSFPRTRESSMVAGVDSRVRGADGAQAAWPAHIRKHAVDAVEGEVAQAPAGAYYLVMTHQHDLDLRIVEAILRRGDFGFLGLIGSHTKRQRFVHRLHERGVAAALIERIVCPIGVPGIAGKEPEVIAVAVVAQLLQRVG